jgi:hypothetical protein
MAAEPLPPYRRGLRPAIPESFGVYVDQELDKIARTLDAHRTFLLAIKAQVDALSTP